jgi:cytochrome P450
MNFSGFLGGYLLPRFKSHYLTARGPVVRVSPNELSFATVESWKAIYGHRSGGAPTPIKSEFYDIYGAGFESLCIGSERNPQKHGQMRKMLSAAFATKSLVEQEHIITTSVNDFVERIGQDALQPLNMTKWYEMVAFDTLGEMAFGQSFNSVKAGKLASSNAGKTTHPPTKWFYIYMQICDSLTRLFGQLQASLTSGRS